MRDNKIIGNGTSLIGVKEAQLIFSDNQVHGNGYLSNQIIKKTKPKDLDFLGY